MRPSVRIVVANVEGVHLLTQTNREYMERISKAISKAVPTLPLSATRLRFVFHSSQFPLGDALCLASFSPQKLSNVYHTTRTST